MEKPLVHQNYRVQKFSGKGGWTFVELPEIPQPKNVPLGWVRVYGCIDDYEFKQYKLMPMGNGKLFLPLKALEKVRNRMRMIGRMFSVEKRNF